MSTISLSRIKYLLLMQTGGGKYNSSKWRIPFLLLVFAGLGIFLAMFYVWLSPSIETSENRIIILYMSFTFIFFYSLNTDKGKEIEFLMLPASTKEKIIAHIIWTIVLPTMIWGFTIPAMIFFQGMANLQAGEAMMSYMPILEILKVGNFISAFFLQSVCAFVLLAFRKWRWFKVVIAFLVVVLAMVFVQFLLNRMEGIQVFVFNAIFLCLTIFVWIANYYKLKKREI